MERCAVVTAVVTGLLLGVPAASASPNLWVYPDTSDPRQGGHVLEPGTFNLIIENRGGGGGDQTVYGVQLVVSAVDLSVVTTLEIEGVPVTPGDAGVGIPPLPCSGRGMPPHSVYPAPYSLVDLGDLEAGSVFVLEVTVDGGDGTDVHFDVIGTSFRDTGNGPKCADVMNPPGHDVTVRSDPGGGEETGRCPHLKVRKWALPMSADVGDPVRFEIELDNKGDCELTSVRIVDALPLVDDDSGVKVPALTFVTADPAPTEATDETVAWKPVDPLASETIWTARIETLVNEVADGQRVVNTVCVDAAELDEPECDTAVVEVGSVEEEPGPASPGFWCHSVTRAPVGGPSAHVSPEELEGWMAEIESDSRVFSELVDVSDLSLAASVLCRPSDADGPFGRLARHLLALWLNAASERIDPETTLDELCPGPEELPEDADAEMTITELIAVVEESMVNGDDDDTLVFWGEVVDYVNNAQVDGETGCRETRTVRSRRRGQHGG
jgi:hypothetical protein